MRAIYFLLSVHRCHYEAGNVIVNIAGRYIQVSGYIGAADASFAQETEHLVQELGSLSRRAVLAVNRSGVSGDSFCCVIWPRRGWCRPRHRPRDRAHKDVRSLGDLIADRMRVNPQRDGRIGMAQAPEPSAVRTNLSPPRRPGRQMRLTALPSLD